MQTATKVHPFEAAGFGHAPFRPDGYSEAKFQDAPGCPIRPGSSCDYCGTAIMGVFWVKSADGRRFKVGCDCIRRVYSEFEASIPAEFRLEFARIEREKRAAKREAAWKRLQERIANARAILAAHPSLFTDMPHPSAGLAAKGLKRRDYLEWLLKYAGDAGRTDACRTIEREPNA